MRKSTVDRVIEYMTHHKGPLTPNQVASDLGTSKTTTIQALNQCVAKGILTKTDAIKGSPQTFYKVASHDNLMNVIPPSQWGPPGGAS